MATFETRAKMNGQKLRVGPGLMVVIPFEGTIRLEPGDDLASDIATMEMTITLIDGVLQPSSVTVTSPEGDPVTGVLLRKVPVQKMTAMLTVRAVQQARRLAAEQEGVYGFGISAFALTPDEISRLREQGPVPESLRMVANLYELGRVMGEPPAKFVEDNLGIPRPTVTRWVRRAREAGFFDGER